MDQDRTIRIHRTEIAHLVCYSAWEPSSYTGPHGTLMRIDGVVHGKIGTRRAPAEIDALPVYSMERQTAVVRWYNAQKEIAYAAIIAAYPEAASGARDGMGEIEVVMP